MNIQLLKAELTRDEALRLTVYDDANSQTLHHGYTLKGNPTIGVGRCLTTRGITPAEADLLLDNDIQSFTIACQQAFTWFNNLSDVRQRVILNMAFNMGIGGLKNFPAMEAALLRGDYNAAADEMQNSAWYRQVGARAQRLVAMMREDRA